LSRPRTNYCAKPDGRSLVTQNYTINAKRVFKISYEKFSYFIIEPWTEEEDAMVVQLVHKYGPQKWTFIADHLPGRIGKQCRER
jgi:hypothetical protein